jgi:hypothetical protein
MARAAGSTSLSAASVIVALAGLTKHDDARGCRHHLTQQFASLCRQLSREKIDPGQIAARRGEAGDKTKPDRLVADIEHDGDRRGCRLGLQRRGQTKSNDDRNSPANQFGGERRQPLRLVSAPAVFDRNVLNPRANLPPFAIANAALPCNTKNAPCSFPCNTKNAPCSLVRENSFQNLETIRKLDRQ